MLALDTDTMPGLALSLGLESPPGRLPAEHAQWLEGKGWRLIRKGAGPVALMELHAAVGPDGIRFLEMGKLPGQVEPPVTVAFRHLMEGFRRPGWTLLADLAAGTRQVMFGWARFAPIRLIVADSSVKSLITARRLRVVGTHIVANRVRGRSDLDAVRRATDLPLLAAIPYDELMAEAERRGRAPIDFAPTSPAVLASAELARSLEEL